MHEFFEIVGLPLENGDPGAEPPEKFLKSPNPPPSKSQKVVEGGGIWRQLSRWGKNFPVCGLCAGVCRDFEYFHKFPCVGAMWCGV